MLFITIEVRREDGTLVHQNLGTLRDTISYTFDPPYVEGGLALHGYRLTPVVTREVPPPAPSPIQNP